MGQNAYPGHVPWLRRDSFATLVEANQIHFRTDPMRDTFASRYSFIKAAIKRHRFGYANMSVSEIQKWIERHPQRAAGTNPRAKRAKET